MLSLTECVWDFQCGILINMPYWSAANDLYLFVFVFIVCSYTIRRCIQVAFCTCDLTSGQSDVNCCCDVDCSVSDRQMFTACDELSLSEATESPACVDPGQLFRHNSEYEVVLELTLLCGLFSIQILYSDLNRMAQKLNLLSCMPTEITTAAVIEKKTSETTRKKRPRNSICKSMVLFSACASFLYFLCLLSAWLHHYFVISVFI